MLLRCLRALVVTCVAAGFLLLAPGSSEASPGLHLSRVTLIQGESVTVTGTVGGKLARTVTLQRRAHGAWVGITKVRTTRTGGFTFRYRPPSTGKAGIALRVIAPKAKLGARRLAQVVSTSRIVYTVTPTAKVDAPSSARSTAAVAVRGTFTPARPGRATEVQRWDGDAWKTMATGVQNSSGASTFSVGLVETGSRAVRVRTLAANGAPATASAAKFIEVADPNEPAASPGQRSGPTGVTAVAGDGHAIVTWDPSTAEDLAGYRVYAAPGLDGPWTLLTTDLVAPDHEATYTATGLTNATTYAFAVTSVYADASESTQSLSELVTPQAPSPETPTDDPATQDCGPVPAKADGTDWTCTMAEDFNGTTYDKSRWFPQQTFATGTPDAFACYRNTPQTIAVGGGVLSLSVVKVDDPVSCTFGKLSGETHIIAGSLMTYQRFVQQYGRFEARIKTQATAYPGLQEAFWMWPDDRVASEDKWPVAGEIDVSETYSHQPHLSVPFLHYREDANGQQPGLNTAYCSADRGTWNTYTLTWTASRIEIDVNGKTCLVNTSGDVAFQKPYQLIFTAALGSQDDAYDGRSALPATMQVDYVRAWK